MILGVDLVPIKPIPHVVTATEDITTESCRRWIRSELKDWKADVSAHPVRRRREQLAEG